MLLSILNSVFCVAFILFAYVNLNDKDSWLWVPIYMVASICCGFAIFNLFILSYTLLPYLSILFMQSSCFLLKTECATG
ncbi:transmembrane 220 family protein [Pedobacter steynii]